MLLEIEKAGRLLIPIAHPRYTGLIVANDGAGTN
jgi:hypothetical protein